MAYPKSSSHSSAKTPDQSRIKLMTEKPDIRRAAADVQSKLGVGDFCDAKRTLEGLPTELTRELALSQAVAINLAKKAAGDTNLPEMTIVGDSDKPLGSGLSVLVSGDADGEEISVEANGNVMVGDHECSN
jgi:hypothetical protein